MISQHGLATLGTPSTEEHQEMSNRDRNHGHEDHDDDDLHDRGLQFDLQTLMQRRHALKLFSGAAMLALVGCSDKKDETPAATATSGSTAATGAATSAGTNASVAATTAGSVAATAAATVSPIPTSATPLSSCTVIPTETAGPYPGDGSNGPNALAASGIVRSDITSSFGTSTTVAKGVLLTIALTLVDTKNSCKPMNGAAVYLWHCDQAGLYSMYSPGATNENYCRGVQAADANGVAIFKSIFPGAYSGRWPHIHFEIYPSLAVANSSSNKRATSQLALPEDVCKTVYATSGYAQSLTNLAQTPLARDNVFSDGWALQMADVKGSVANGYTATLPVGV
jgi:protocatechuate 3,4-dioxygenase beta subunit